MSGTDATGLELTEIPTSQLPDGGTHNQRRLQNSHTIDYQNLNKFDIMLNGLRTHRSFHYVTELTPLVTSITPNNVSSAITTSVTISGIGISLTTSVTVGGQECVIDGIESMGDGRSSVSCLLLRTKSPQSSLLQQVLLYIPGQGFAGQFGSVYEPPTLYRGFEVNAILPAQGSVYGGNTIVIRGFGFEDPVDSHYSVQLLTENFQPNAYQELLLKLNLPAAPSLGLNCTVIAVSADSLNCSLPYNLTALNTTTSYEAVVTLNGVTSMCANNNIQKCTYTQTNSSSPVVYFADILSESSVGAVTVAVYGHNFGNESVTVWLGGLECAVLLHTATKLIVVSPPIDAGLQQVVVFVGTMGYANGGVYVDTSLTIHTATVSAAQGSVSGGAILTLTGVGFSSRSGCISNYVLMVGNSITMVNATRSIPTNETQAEVMNVTHILTCSPNEITAWIPALVAGVSTLSTFDEIMVTVNSVTQSAALARPYSYSLSYTPTVTLSSSSGFAQDSILVTVQTIGDAAPERTLIYFGDTPCLTQDQVGAGSVAAVWNCTIPILAAGLYPVIVNTYPYGTAVLSTGQTSPTFNSLLSVRKMTPAVFASSIGGGARLHLTGRGFSNATTVTICGSLCTYEVTTYNSLTCSVPPLLTTSAVQDMAAMNISNDSIASINGSIFASVSTVSLLANVDDYDYTTFFRHDYSSCYVGIKLPSGLRAQPYRMRFYPRLQFSSIFGRVVFEGSTNGGKTYVQLGTATGAHEGWNFINVAGGPVSKQWYTHLRFRPNDGYDKSHCSLAEIDFLGVVAATNSNCSVVVSNPGEAIQSAGAVSYQGLHRTPVVTSISPNNGTALGGTVVHVTGYNFLASGNNVQSLGPIVSLSGIECQLLNVSATTIVCVTSPRSPENIETMSIKVLFPQLGYAVVDDHAKFLYVDKWSARTSWLNQEPPVEGDLVYIPDGQVLSLDIFTPVFSVVVIEGALYFDNTRDVSLDAFYIFVNGGLLQVGTADEPFVHNATITLHGDRYKTVEIPYIGAKVRSDSLSPV